ncbi:MAG: hypothetical protein E7371_03350 [Clostridiales bacterium]|jgi:hypothetical protein|nr:hypothetical protein [Clostridiales bacterium]
MAKKEKRKKRDDLDMETTIADMNVEGFSWYDPNRKNGKSSAPQLTKKEQRALMRGAFRAMLPMIMCIITGMLLVFLLAFLWLS